YDSSPINTITPKFWRQISRNATFKHDAHGSARTYHERCPPARTASRAYVVCSAVAYSLKPARRSKTRPASCVFVRETEELFLSSNLRKIFMPDSKPRQNLFVPCAFVNIKQPSARRH